jgi:hypothetical protein
MVARACGERLGAEGPQANAATPQTKTIANAEPALTGR